MQREHITNAPVLHSFHEIPPQGLLLLQHRYCTGPAPAPGGLASGPWLGAGHWMKEVLISVPALTH